MKREHINVMDRVNQHPSSSAVIEGIKEQQISEPAVPHSKPLYVLGKTPELKRVSGEIFWPTEGTEHLTWKRSTYNVSSKVVV